jgi:hypothetical protein
MSYAGISSVCLTVCGHHMGENVLFYLAKTGNMHFRKLSYSEVCAISMLSRKLVTSCSRLATSELQIEISHYTTRTAAKKTYQI